MATGGVPDAPEGVICCFVCDGETVYAVVCKHLTATAYGQFSVDGLPFAKAMRKKKKGETPVFTDFDIDLIKVDKNKVQKCNQIFYDAKGNAKPGRLYEGDINDVEECEVFTHKSDKPTIGKVLHVSNIDKTLEESYILDNHFVVGGDSFSVAGDSGRIVAMMDDKYEDGCLKLVGMIVHKAGDQTVCLKLHKGLQYLENKYGLKLSLWVPEERYKSSENTLIEPGDFLKA